jgi:hypothetical protein
MTVRPAEVLDERARSLFQKSIVFQLLTTSWRKLATGGSPGISYSFKRGIPQAFRLSVAPNT